MHGCVGVKRSMVNENSTELWHRRLRHISKERIHILGRRGILRSLDFSDFGVCVDYIKGKLTKIKKKGFICSAK